MRTIESPGNSCRSDDLREAFCNSTEYPFDSHGHGLRTASLRKKDWWILFESRTPQEKSSLRRNHLNNRTEAAALYRSHCLSQKPPPSRDLNNNNSRELRSRAKREERIPRRRSATPPYRLIAHAYWANPFRGLFDKRLPQRSIFSLYTAMDFLSGCAESHQVYSQLSLSSVEASWPSQA